MFRTSSQQAFSSYEVPFVSPKSQQRSAKELRNDDKIILNEVFWEIAFLNLANEDLPAEDLLTTRLKAVLKTHSKTDL